MVLRTGKLGDLPENAVRLTESEAFEYQLKAAENWKRPSEMWPLQYGSLAVGSSAIVSGAIINNYFKKMCYLPASSWIMVGVPLFTISSLITTFLHHGIITRDVMLMKSTCTPCTQTRTALLLGFGSTVYPVFACSVGNMLFAQKLDTIYLPSITKETRKFFQEWRKMINKKGNVFFYLFIFNVAFGLALGYLQQQASYKLNEDH